MIIDMGTISARGQVAIPAKIRKELQLNEGEQIVFISENGTLIIKKTSDLPWDELTRPLREAAARAGLKEEDIPALVKKVRRASSSTRTP